MAAEIALPRGYSLHEYQIEQTLGIGGFGLAYLVAAPTTLHPATSQISIIADLNPGERAASWLRKA